GVQLQFNTTVHPLVPLNSSMNVQQTASYSALLHEEGHVIGLNHGGPYNNSKTGSQQFSAYDTKLWTLMSYFEPDDQTAQFYNNYPVTGTNWNAYDPT